MGTDRRTLMSAAVAAFLLLVSAAAAFAATLPAQSRVRPAAAGRVFELPFSGPCARGRTPHVLGALAQVTVPASWHTVHVPPYGCAQPYLLSDRRRDANLCLEESVSATMAPSAGETPASFLGRGYPVLARGRLPAASGMSGVWEQVDVGVTPASPSSQVDAALEAPNRKVFYELIVVPPIPVEGCPAATGPLARGIARQLASSFRVLVTHPATAETWR